MNWGKWAFVSGTCAIFLALLATGCNGDTGKTAATGEKLSAPVDLVMFQQGANINDEEFAQLIAEPVKQKYPNITVNLVRNKDGSIEDLIAAGSLPDMTFTSHNSLNKYSQLGLAYDITNELKKNKIDIQKYDATAMKTIQSRSDKGEIWGMPFSVNFSALYYNKDLFDKFAVSYPRDGMTWDDAIELAKKLSRVDGGTQYAGLDIEAYERLGGQLSLSVVDRQTGKAALLSNGWPKVFQTYKTIKEIPGNTYKGNPKPAFENDRVLAMFGSRGARVGEFEEMFNSGKAMNWDMATMPTFPESPGKAFAVDIHMLTILATSKHKDPAFQVLSYLVGEEAQSEMNKRGRLSSLKDTKIRETFGANLSSMKGKNIRAVYATEGAEEPPYSDNTSIVKKELGPAIKNVLNGKEDINTALRNAEERANQAIAALNQ
jgi:multiple sugar transport system substrate-binding protein